MPGPTIAFENVSLVLGGTSILDQVSFRIEAGALHCIVGPNGGGKTSLIRALLGQMPHTGNIRLEGEPDPVIGYVPQAVDFDRNVPMTVSDVMALISQRKPAFFGPSRRLRHGIDAALDRMGIGAKKSRPFSGLSGGERQRVLFAQALNPVPQLLVLDEPTANIDTEGARIVETVVLELNAQGVTVVWVNHDWAQVRRIAHAVTTISHRVIFSGPAAQLPSWDQPQVVAS